MRAARVTIVVVSVVVAAWFGLGARQAHDTTLAMNLTQPGNLTDRQATRARSLLKAAGLLNPDREVPLLRARVDQALSNNAGARRILVPLSRAEPMNIDVWFALANVAGGHNRLELSALKHIAQLLPTVHHSQPTRPPDGR